MDNIRTAKSVEYCSIQVRKLLQTDLIWNFTIVVLPFLMQFFSICPILTVTAGSYREYWLRLRIFVLYKVEK